MVEGLSTVIGATVRVALDGLAQRQQVIANNIANANSADFTAQRVEFEAALREVIADAPGLSADAQKAQLRRLNAAVNAGEYHQTDQSAAVALDQEMVRLNETVIQYQALLEGLSKYGSMARSALEEGKR